MPRTSTLGPARQRAFWKVDPSRRHTDMGKVPCMVALHDSTSPESIAADQRQAVLDAMRSLVTSDISAISEAVFLPAFTVKRRLAEIFGKKTPRPEKRPAKVRRVDVIADLIRREGPLTARQISDATGIPAQTVQWYVRVKGQFRVCGTTDATEGPISPNKPVRLWSLAGQQQQKGKVRS